MGKPPDLVFRRSTTPSLAASSPARLEATTDTFEDKTCMGDRRYPRYRYRIFRSEPYLHPQIDSQIDRERAKVVNDLLFTGRVRPWPWSNARPFPSTARAHRRYWRRTLRWLRILQLGLQRIAFVQDLRFRLRLLARRPP